MKEKCQSAPNFFDTIERVCKSRQLVIVGFIMAAFTLLSLLLFNMRVSEGGDDSTYIIRAVNFINDGAYPSFQGPLYPVFLSFFVAIFGLNLGVLKLSSLLLMVAGIWFFYRVFRERIPYVVLFGTLLITSFSSFYIYFSSQTYSEALFILLQLPVFGFVFKLDERKDNQPAWTLLLGLSLAILATYLTRTVGVGALIAVLIFFIFRKRYKEGLLVAGGFVVLLFLFLLLKSAIWHNGFFDSGQASTLLYKHPYQMDQGKETLGGFLGRFIDNSNLYLSKHYLRMTGLRAAEVKSVNGVFTLVLYFLFILGSIRAFKRDSYLFFTALYTAVMLGITFVVLQKLWDQYRLIVPFFSFMTLILLYGIYGLAAYRKSQWPGRMVMALVIFCCGSTLLHSFASVDLLTLRKNLKGDLYEGYTDDWRNYLSMAEYVGDELPEEAYVAVRKPNMARIYAGGKKFYGIYRYDTDDPDLLLQRLRDRKVSHVIMASLRKNPNINNGQTINTIQRYLYIVSKKYPELFRLEHQIGSVEPSYLFRIDYGVVE
ncbi:MULTISPECIES: hypothetical protein [unclassified Carboxylicivirga]|uniref:hypothetical protein n=1 Tax=Carboxylicivirga TaxID=1628153 RepID=UPI003D356626